MKATGMVLYNRYATYQVCLDVYSDELSQDDIFKKVFLYVVNWVKERLKSSQAINIGDFSEFDKYPKVEEYEKLSFDMIKDFNEAILTDMRTVFYENGETRDWAFRQTEPDNGSEGKAIAGREFITEISLHEGDGKVSLAVMIEVKQPENVRKTPKVYRPAFIKSMFKDEYLILVEHGIDRKYAFTGKCIYIESHSDCKEVSNNLLLNIDCQLPVIIFPEIYKNVEQNMEVYRDGKLQKDKVGIDYLAGSLVGFAHVVVISEKEYNKLFYTRLQNEDEVFLKMITMAKKPYFYIPASEYIAFGSENLYVDKSKLDTESLLKDLSDMAGDSGEWLSDDEDFSEMRDLAMNYQLGKNYNYAPCMFYRTLRSKYLESRDGKDSQEEAANLRHYVAELNEKLRSKDTELAKLEKTVDEYKKNDILTNVEKKEKDERISDLENELSRKEEEYRELISKNNLVSNDDYPLVTDETRVAFKDKNVRSIIVFDARYADFNSLIKDKLLELLRNTEIELTYAKDTKYSRRRECIEIVLEYEKAHGTDTGLYYPAKLDLFENEIREMIQDVFYKHCTKNNTAVSLLWLKSLLKDNNFNEEMGKRGRRFYNELKGKSDPKDIGKVLMDYGFERKKKDHHSGFAYYGMDRLFTTFANTPSDSRGTKNGAQILCNMVF